MGWEGGEAMCKAAEYLSNIIVRYDTVQRAIILFCIALF